MSSEGDNIKNLDTETADKSTGDTTDSSQDSQDLKNAKPEKENDKDADVTKNDVKVKQDPTSPSDTAEKPSKTESVKEKENAEKEEKDVKNEVVDTKENSNKTNNETEKGEESEKEGEGSEKDEEDKEVPLLDQPLEQSGPRERKKVQRFNEDFVATATETKESTTKTEIPNGCGTQLGEIPRIDASISRFKNDDLKLLHRLLFKNPGKTTLIKKNIKRFNGFDFKKDSDEYSKKLLYVQKFEVKQLKSVCEMLDLDKKGNKDEISERIMEFLLEPKDSGKPAGGGRPKRTAAVRANNRGYSSHDDSYSSDERHSRFRRDKGRRSNLKDESTSGSDEEFHPSDASDEKPRTNKRRTSGRKKVPSEDDASDLEESVSSEESDDEPRSKRKKGPNKVVNSKAKGKTGAKRGRKPAAATANKKKAPVKKGGRKRAESSEEEEEESEPQEEDASSSEDEPLAKKAKSPLPPTDEEIKSYVKEILEGANLEEITMKTVCKQVYAHYPDFDLAHKKDFIKTTVKSLIST